MYCNVGVTDSGTEWRFNELISLANTIPPLFHTHISLIRYQSYTIVATDNFIQTSFSLSHPYNAYMRKILVAQHHKFFTLSIL